MPRIDFCDSADENSINKLIEAIERAGATIDMDFEDGWLGFGLSTWFLGTEKITVYKDAFRVDFHASDAIVARIVELLENQE